ncbi:hypothetical protein QTJ16_006065 [Diplocarpon rosae]|uniref:2EXR domain-containing protein n=1 Tax=Diplocarpon rosae TaxID=946125 RepID=A0AAD9WB27_9HELO|nr:hypothetical protein QTJ16_006065 [Diplocarpon rosae]
MTGIALRKRFHCFPKLPLEIRLMIWEAALPGPRLVNVWQGQLKQTSLHHEVETGRQGPAPNEWDLVDEYGEFEETRYDEDQAARVQICRLRAGGWHQRIFWDSHLLGIRSDCPPPSITFVCRESYHVVVRRYAKVFAYPNSVAQTYFDFERDTLYLRPEAFSRYSAYGGLQSILDGLSGPFELEDQASLGRVQRLAISISSSILCTFGLDGILLEVLALFKGLRVLSMVVRDYNQMLVREYGPISGESSADSCLVGPLDIRKAIMFYGGYREQVLNGYLPRVRLPLLENVELVREVIARLKASWAAAANSKKSTLRPTVVPAAIVSPRLKRDLDRVEHLYMVALANSEEAKLRDNLQAAGWNLDDVFGEVGALDDEGFLS